MGLLSLYGKGLQGKFVKLGTLKGRTQSEIVASVGKPNSISAAAGGKRLVQWITPGYHIALLFDADGVCEGVTHEFKT
jgi:hypothetical protein